MNFINIKHPDEAVSFRHAVLTGLGRDQGLYFPRHFSHMDDIPSVLGLDFVTRSVAILQHLTHGEIPEPAMADMVAAAFDFPVPVKDLSGRVHALELFHGPSLAFKDFGARFLAQCLAQFREEGPMTILTATSGDTGAAVAHAFYGQPGVEVVVLYPRGRISPLQEKLFCTLGGNVHTVAVESDFDTCQRLVKQAFEDVELRRTRGLNSANSINIARLLAQVCYYFEAAASVERPENLVFSVPSGNFGNLTAGLVARAIGLPYKRIIAATNANDTVPRFLASGHWVPRLTVATITNAMDVSDPNNFPRVLEMDWSHGLPLRELLSSCALTDEETRSAIRSLWQQGYLADPHSALAWAALARSMGEGEEGAFLCTAHPAKFIEVMKDTLGIDIPLPPELAAVQDKEILSSTIPGDFAVFRKFLLERF